MAVEYVDATGVEQLSSEREFAVAGSYLWQLQVAHADADFVETRAQLVAATEGQLLVLIRVVVAVIVLVAAWQGWRWTLQETPKQVALLALSHLNQCVFKFT